MKTEAPTLPVSDTPPREPYVEEVTRETFVPKRVQWVIDAVVLGVIAGVLLSYFRIPLLLSNTTTTGGDTAGHVYPAWYLKTHLLPKGLISGWSPGWYDGLPLLHFYFPLVALIQALLAFAIPYNVAFKLGTVLGTFFLPVAVYLMFRILRFAFPTPIIGAVLSLGFLFMRSYSIFGGNIPSSLAGEYSYSLSMGLSLIVLALLYRLATEKKGRPVLTGILLGLTILCHLVPVVTILMTLPLFLVLAVREHGWRHAWLRLGTVLAIGVGLSAIWLVPFEARFAFSNNLHWIQDRRMSLLAPRELWLYLVAAASGVVLALFTLDRRFLVFLVPATTSLALVAFLPQGARLFNARFFPYWYLSIFLGAAYFIGTVASYLMRAAGSDRWREKWTRWRLPSLVGVLVVGLAVGIMAPSIVNARKTSYIDDWIKWNYEGYQNKATWPELRALFDAVRKLPPGRVMWEPSPDYNNFGTPDVLMSLPFFTGHPTMEGIYYESSITTPYHFLMASELAEHPFNPWPGLPYQIFNLDRGVDHMQMFDIQYFLAWSQRTKAAASASPRLQHIGDAGGFSIYGLRSAAQVTIPAYRPVVLGSGDWNQASMAWFNNPDVLDVPLARDGPGDWPRVPPSPADVPRVPLAYGGQAISPRVTDDSISFDTDAIGEPTLVRTSYFPNWRVEGAKGPYQVSPSVMMVIPTQRHVTLRYERTWAEWSGLVLTLGTILLLLIPWSRRRIVRLDNA
jgi:6-pyruvoyl-tetrahydropterin synthase related domain